MINAITIDRVAGAKKHGAVLDVLERLADECGSATNAAVVCITESKRFKDAQRRLQQSTDSSTEAA